MLIRLLAILLCYLLLFGGITGAAFADGFVSGVGEAQTDIASQGLNYFGDSSALQEVQTTNSNLYQSLETGAGVLFVGYQDTTARIADTITNQDAAIILSRYYGGNPQSGTAAMTDIFGSGNSQNPTAAFDASLLSGLVSGKSPVAGNGGTSWTMNVVDQAGSYAPGTNLTRGAFLNLNFPPPPVVPPPPPSDPTIVWVPPPIEPVYYPAQDIRSMTASLGQPTVRQGNAFAVKAAIVGQPANLLVTVPWGNFPMQWKGTDWEAFVTVPASHATGVYPLTVSGVIQQPNDYMDWKPFQQTLTFLVTSAPPLDAPLPSSEDLPDWWTPPGMQDWFSGY
ncbi:MAG: hypothetical protein ACYCX4_17650 [Bacillota bacterium]